MTAGTAVRLPGRNDAAPWTFFYLLAAIAFLIAWLGVGTTLIALVLHALHNTK